MKSVFTSPPRQSQSAAALVLITMWSARGPWPLPRHLTLHLFQLLSHLLLAFPPVLDLNLLLILFLHPTLLVSNTRSTLLLLSLPVLRSQTSHTAFLLKTSLLLLDRNPSPLCLVISLLQTLTILPLLLLLILLPTTPRTASMSKGYDFIFLLPLPGSTWLRQLTATNNCFGPHKPMFMKMRLLISALRSLIFVLGSQEVEILAKAVLRIEWCEMILSIVVARLCTLFCFWFFFLSL